MKPASSCNKLAALLLAAMLAGCAGAPVQKNDEPAVSSGSDSANIIDANAQHEHDLARGALSAGNIQESVKILEALIHKFPEYQTPYITLGLALKKLERYDDAEAKYRHVLKLNNHYAEAYNQLAVMYREQGKLELALQTYEQGLAIAPNHPGLNLNIGILYDLYLRRPQKALLHYQTYYNEVPDTDVPVKLWISDLQQRLN